MDPSIISALVGSGPLGVVCLFLLQQRKEERAERLQYDKDRLETDKSMARAIMALAMKVTGKPTDGDQA
ncbi:hypothetical protein S2M10_31570 [Sphingomonas sp. S2M10]|uniref:hypothetical protein n=1 Tax=Sphingomonas sp. S2M10 TaxID=2705010 RepID=UPI0014571E9D|nr:hypothetical protein [Sphingomonas sp. S2M10]NLS28148.1 hypothetical protein [Sphingomonas sp. S2M10]